MRTFSYYTVEMSSAINTVNIANVEEYEKDREELLTLLRTFRIPTITKNRINKTTGEIIIKERENIIGRIGRTCNFGLTRSRRTGYCNSRHCLKRPDVYKKIFDFGKHVCPAGMDVTSVTLNLGVKAKKHIDSFNVGDSVIVGIGNYTNGKLRVYSSDSDYVAHDILNKPLMFNGSVFPHETEDFEGERYTIIYYSMRPKNREWTVDYPISGTAIVQ